MSSVNHMTAFPLAASEYGGNGSEFGMELRDYFAAKAMQALMTATSSDLSFLNLEWAETPNGPTVAEHVSALSYRMANAMLEAREK